VDFVPSYDPKGILERTEPVPFRLTRNLHTFFTPFGVEGVFVSAMAAAAQASTQLRATICGRLPIVRKSSSMCLLHFLAWQDFDLCCSKMPCGQMLAVRE
jgi:transformation/transcription domain-associated protein